MKKRGLLLLGVMLLLLLPSTVYAFGNVEGKFPIDFALTFCWDGWPCGVAGVTVFRDGTFTTDDGGVGNWTYDRETGYAALDFTVGCFPLYEGYNMGGMHFEGEMNCRDGSGGHGTWSADRIGVGFVPIPGPRSSAGQ